MPVSTLFPGQLRHQVYNMDACFYNTLGIYSFEAQCEMLAEIGFDATYLSLWTPQAFQDLDKLRHTRERYGLDVAAIYVVPDLAQGINHPKNLMLLDMIERLEGCTTVEIAIQAALPGIRPSDPAGDDRAVEWLMAALKVAERRGIDLLLYSHLSFWVERHEDAVRLCKRIGHPNLGIVFCGYHWYARDGADLARALASVGPWLKQVNLSGSRRDPNGFAGVATIEPLDEGELDNFQLLGELRRMGYAGRIGFEGWDWGGDIYGKPDRSLRAYRGMEARLNANPDWAVLRA